MRGRRGELQKKSKKLLGVVEMFTLLVVCDGFMRIHLRQDISDYMLSVCAVYCMPII